MCVNKWLKEHYDEIAKSMNDPYLPNNSSLDNELLGNFGLKFLTIIDNNVYKVKPSENDYRRYFITDENLYKHLKYGYISTFKKLEEATNIEELNNYATNLNGFISNINDKVDEEIKNFAPKLKPAFDHNSGKCEYIISNIIHIIIIQIDSELHNIRASKFEKRLLDSKNSMLTIGDGIYTAIKVSEDFHELDNFIIHLNNIHKDFIEYGKELYEQNKKICDKYNNFIEDLKIIQNNYFKSGIPLHGICDICKKTKEAKSLMPHDCK